MEKLGDKRQRALRLLHDLENLREEILQCDFEVRIGENTFPVHRSVLAASSDYFKAMLKTDMKEANQGYVEMKELEIEAVKACLDYLYAGEVFFDPSKIEPMLKASDMMQIEDLKQMLFDYILKSLSVENCLQIRSHAIAFSSDKAMNISETFIAENFARISGTVQFKLLDEGQLQACLKLFKGLSGGPSENSTSGHVMSLLNYTGFKVKKAAEDLPTVTQWKAVASWIEFNQAERTKHLLKLLKRIEPLDISAVLYDILSHPLLESRQDCQDYLVEEVVLPNSDRIGKYIEYTNQFDVMSWAKRFNSDDLRKNVRRAMAEGFPAISRSERIGELDFEDIRSILKDGMTRKRREFQRYFAIINWTRECESERQQHFEELFGLLDLRRLNPDFIHDTVRKEPLVKSHPSCTEKIMDALYEHTKKK